MEDNTPLYIKIPVDLKEALSITAKRERTSLVGLCTNILTTGVSARSTIDQDSIKKLIDSARVHGQN